MMEKNGASLVRFRAHELGASPLPRFTAGASGVARCVCEVRKSLLLKSFRLRIVHMVIGREN